MKKKSLISASWLRLKKNIEREQAIAALKAEKAHVEKWCKSSTKISEIINAQIPESDRTGLGFWKPQNVTTEESSSLKFGTFVTSFFDTSYNQFYPCFSSNSIPEEKFKDTKSVDKGKSILLPQKATRKAKLKVASKPTANQSSSSVIEIFDLCPPKLKIDLKSMRSEEMKIPPRSHEKSLLGPGPAHLKLAKPTSGPKTVFKYRKCYHCGFTDHIESKCPTATKADKTAKVKINASKAEKVTKVEKSTKVKNTTKVKKLTKVKITTEAESSSAEKTAETSLSTNSKGPIENGCSRHMTGQKDLFTEYKEEKGPSVTFGGNGKGYTRGFGVLSNGTTCNTPNFVVLRRCWRKKEVIVAVYKMHGSCALLQRKRTGRAYDQGPRHSAVKYSMSGRFCGLLKILN
ncbi:hypothetical protein L6452_34613 [Arctium lappa]|uniref:Uncharacterized protein n=1 Tax=Arctium lappa TaxID=4217 RepID=A0ACB8YIT7_ARCLA|nr:hypothetical protein L6452_34613 [Arctium lappa]